MLKDKKIGVGFYFLIPSLVFGVLGLIYYQMTYSIFGYSNDRLSITLSVISIWLTAFLVVDTIFTRDNPTFSNAFYAIVMFMMTYALLRLLTPCLSPIGIYLTVGNMGDVETNAIAVPKCFIATAFYIISIITFLVGSILGTTKKVVKKDAGLVKRISNSDSEEETIFDNEDEVN